VLGPYLNKDITITLPEGKTIPQIRWLAVYDLTRHEPFGEVEIPQGFEPPQPVALHSMVSRQGHISSNRVQIIDSKTIRLTGFDYDGSGQEAYFWVGTGQQPHGKGSKIPDEMGYLTPLRRYHKATVTLTLPGNTTVYDIKWLAVYDVKAEAVLGFVLLHEGLNVPPSLVHITPHSSRLPQCEQLHRDLQMSWDLFGDQVTIQLAARTELNEYISFGVSGDPTRPEMVGGDGVLLHRDQHLAFVRDINITARFPCTELLKQKRGVCWDEEVGGIQDYQIMSTSRADGVSVYTYRRRLNTADHGDKPYLASGPMMIIWAIGRIDGRGRPAMHRAWSKVAQPLDLGRPPDKDGCFSFTHEPQKKLTPWPPTEFTDTTSRSFKVRLGPDGGPNGYEAITGYPSLTGKAWYIDDFLVPELYVMRNREYKFLVEGGASPHDPANYHPFIITDEPHGGFSQLSGEEQAEVRVLAGVDYTQRGAVRPMRGGRLCEWRHPAFIDRRRDADVALFAEYRNNLRIHCDEGEASTLTVHPNKSWPATVYYNSWTGFNMGGRIHVLDEGPPGQ